ncbi:MAG TPA: response regulator [Bryobacteraceae bacterium]|jgi:DNA-binding NarL/FixJ family response regulator|nr:response regulator [Bryobacteraceae bacterium]
MADQTKITILLADEDALRRDGLAAVLQGTAGFNVIAQCPDGEAALARMRDLRPDVAVIDLNIPKVHGIEMIRRVRSENLGTKIVILSGSTDDDIIREVVRAGGDAYLLKNGPARHLIDAINYVQDGGQYFSPQLRRDGLDRHLLQEVPRPAARQEERYEEPIDGEEDDDLSARQIEKRPREAAGRYGRSRRPPVRRTADPQRLRERLREEGEGEDLGDRDYEILSQMADGIRPILDRLDEIEGRINGMETGDEPVPNDVRGWLSTQMTDTFRGSGGKDLVLGRTVQDLEARLPSLIEEAVTSRFHHLADKLQQEIEDTHVRTLETFVKNIQVKLVQRVSALETDMSKQAEAMSQLREYSQRTEDNLSRLISGVDRLAHELPKRLESAAPAAETQGGEIRKKRRKPRFSPKVFWMVVGAVLVVVGAGAGLTRMSSSRKASAASNGTAAAAMPSGSSKLAEPSANADSKTKLLAAQEYADKKDYATAEDILKQVVKAEPRNVDALKGLADVLYREDKIEESADVLDKIPHD